MSERKRKGIPPASSEAAKSRMKAAKPRNTVPEITLQNLLTALGLEFETDSPIPSIRRKVDILFRKERLAIFVDGCFWHGCPVHGTWPKENADFWKDKIETNKKRDIDTNHRLENMEWSVMRIWEHEDLAAKAEIILEMIKSKRESLTDE